MSDNTPQMIQITQHGESVLLSVSAGQLTALRTIDAFGDALSAAVSTRSESRFVIDFVGVTFMVTPAVNALLKASKQLKQRNGRLIICGLNRNIDHVFKLMKLDRVLTIAPDAETALQQLETE
jgi:anti-anti-sigma factor